MTEIEFNKDIDKLEPQNHEDNYIQEIKEYYYLPLLAALLLGIILMFIKRGKN